MRINFALPEYYNSPIGGYRVAYTYADNLARRGHSVNIVFPRFITARRRPQTRVTSAFWAAKLRSRNRPLVTDLPRDSPAKVVLVPGLNQLPEADVVVATAWQTAEGLADAPRAFGRKFYLVYDYEYLMTSDPATRARIEATYRAPFTRIASSTIVGTAIRAAGGCVATQIACGINLQDFGVDVPPEDRAPTTIGFPARPESFKGTEDAIAAATLLREKFGPALRCLAFGRTSAAIPSWIEHHPRPSQQELRAIYNEVSVFMVPSHFEGWGLPGCEAMACGAALVTTDNGGCRDYAIDGETALVIPPRAPHDLMSAAARLIDDGRERVRLARSGRAFIERFTWKAAVDALESAFVLGECS